MDLPIKWDRILLPRQGTDLTKWAVVACDQYTASPEYWEKVKSEVGGAPSSLNLILPEVYLGRDEAARAVKIGATMKEYVAAGIFDIVDDGVILVERTTTCHNTGAKKTRRGFMVAVDLEAYSFAHEDRAAIRATEGTVVERLPPRAAVREQCDLELPHIMQLVDDPEDNLIAPLFEMDGRVLYDFELMAGGGRLRGKLVDGRVHVEAALNKLLADSIDRYGSSFLFGVGDGNHSLAAAQSVWKKTRDPKARYALCEVVNIYDKGLEFEPIHRVVFGVNAEDLKKFLLSSLRAERSKPPQKNNKADCFADARNSDYNLIADGEKMNIALPKDPIEAVAFVQKALDDYGGEIDYIHGKEDLEALCGRGRGNVGILLPAMPKDALFPYCAAKGALPRKTFSMGEAYEKRYYMEARKIRG